VGVVFAVAAGGALGAVTRYGLSALMARLLGTGFPWGTLLVNVVGSFALGYLAMAWTTRPTPEAVRAVWTVGFLGALTTFSTFSVEAIALLQDSHYGRAGLYVIGSVLLALVAASLGLALASAGSVSSS